MRAYRNTPRPGRTILHHTCLLGGRGGSLSSLPSLIR